VGMAAAAVGLIDAQTPLPAAAVSSLFPTGAGPTPNAPPEGRAK